MAILSRNASSGDDATAVEETVTSPTRSLASGMARVNLLPPELLEERRVRIVKIGAGVAAAAAVVLVAGGWYMANHSLDQAKSDHQAAEDQNARLQTEVTRYGSVDQLYRKVDAAEAMVATATANEVHWSTYLDDLSISMPQHVWLTNLQMGVTAGAATAPGTAAAAGTTATPALPTIGSVTLTGSGYVHNDVANLLEQLAKIKGFTNVYLSSSTEALLGQGTTKVPTVNWSSTVSLDSDALAHPNGGGDR